MKLMMFQGKFRDPGNDFVWAMKMLEPVNAEAFITFDDNEVAVLDVAPQVKAFSSADVPFTGSNISVDCVPSVPATVFFLPLFTVPNVTQTVCVFLPTSPGLANFSRPAYFAFISQSLITLLCETLSNGQLGPPFSVWKMSVRFSDGRESSASTVSFTVRCPAGMYIEFNAAPACISPPCCLSCPAPMSMSVGIDSLGINSCICKPGYYGPGGLACIACPKNVDGFNCLLPNRTWPMIQAGFYIDYSRLSGCSEFSPKCDAIVKCPNEKACPGTKEKDCLITDEECYNSEVSGCAACCPQYYIENFVCKPCPPSRMPLILALCAFALIIFAVFSSTFDFPPLVSVAQSLKIFLSNMQGFVSIRLLAISWPPIVLSMFDFTRYFTFNFDIIRPECTVDYTPQTKLVFMLIGPVACAMFIIMLVCMYTVFKCFRITRMLQNDAVKTVSNKSFYETALSVAQCLLTSSFCLKFSNSRMMADGALWNALSPALALRTDTLVLQQKVRRRAVTQEVKDSVVPLAHARVVPEDWTRMQAVVAGVHAEPEFARSAKRFRLLIASALSIFIFTFQSSIESALSTFDCKIQNDVRFLRSNPKFKCSFDDDIYFRMVTTTIIGLSMYCVLLPAVTVITLRSRWCREVYVHDSVAYGQMFGFLTSMYSKACAMWELVACLRKVAFVAIPVLVSAEALVQSVSIFSCLIIYTFFVLKKQPMVSSTLNQIELLSCISVIVGCFSSIFFVVEHKGSLVLSGTSRDLAGLLLVVVCALCGLLSFRLMWKDFSSKLIFKKNKYFTLFSILNYGANRFQALC
jgi:hypothetical protein